MNRVRPLLSIVFPFALMLVAQGASAQDDRPRVPGELLVQFHEAATAAQITVADAVLERHNIKHLRSLLNGKVHKYAAEQRTVGVAEEALAAELMATGAFTFVEPNYLVEPALVPDDTRFEEQWHHKQIRSMDAWDNVVGDRSALIAVCDAGFDIGHPDLWANLQLPGQNIVDGTTNLVSTREHGTAVMGTIGAVGNNGQDVTGVAWRARMLPVQISNSSDGRASYESILRCIDLAAELNARVVNLSYAPVYDVPAIDAAAAHLREHGGLLVVAAGNNGNDLSAVPNSPNMLVVGATTSADILASFSNYGGPVDLVAPGAGILTTVKFATHGSTVGLQSGTSFSAPILAGVAALLFAVNQDFTPAEVEDIILSTTVDLGDPGPDVFFARGRVDAAAAVAEALRRRDTLPPVVKLTSPGDGATVSDIIALSATATDNVAVMGVRLGIDERMLAEFEMPPFEMAFETRTVDNGWHEVWAEAFDEAGNLSRASVSIHVDNSIDVQPPTVVIASPADGETVAKKVKVDVIANDDVQIGRVLFFVDGVRVAIDADAPYHQKVDTRLLDEGWHQLRVEAEDTAGNSTWTSVHLRVQNAKH